MDVFSKLAAYVIVFVAGPLLVILNRPEPNYQELIGQCRRSTTQATVQRVYHETHNVAATEGICGVHDLQVNKGQVVTFEMPVTIVKP
jgi:hypothetical protein